jgi:hypothetical protein
LAKQPLFTNDPATDLAYINIRDGGSDTLKRARKHCEELWEIFEPYADDHFRRAIRDNFDPRYWEMYLTCTLIALGYKVACPKPGPDVGIEFEGRRIWFEATCPTGGADKSQDKVPSIEFGAKIAPAVPNEKMVLRYLNSISEKCLGQYPSWLEQGTVKREDAFVVAINPREIDFDQRDTQPPRILQAAFHIGARYVVIDTDTLKQVYSGYHFRDKIPKASGASVPTGVFYQNQYRALSGLLCSRVCAVSRPEELGAEFQMVPNPFAGAPLPDAFRLRGTYFRVDKADEGYNIVPEGLGGEANRASHRPS